MSQKETPIQTSDESLIDEIGSRDDRPTYLGASGSKLQVLTTILCSAGFVLFGYDQGVMGGLLTLPHFRRVFTSIDTTLHKDAQTSTMQGFVVAVYEIGCLFGALTNLKISDRYGRLRSIFIGCILMIIGAIIQTTSYSIAQLIVGRIVTGLGNGMNTSSIPVYQSETTKPESRGKLVMISGALITGGVALSYWIDFGFYFVDNEASFRFPIAFQMIFPMVMCPFLFKLPESPRWLARKGRWTEAAEVFAAFDDAAVNDESVIYKVSSVKRSLMEERDAGLHELPMAKRLFTQGKHRNFQRLCLGFWSQVFQQITGINLITYYSATIFETYIGMSALKSRILAGANGTEYFLASFIAFFTIERYGRRPLMLFGAAGQAITMALLTIFTWFAENKNISGMGVASAVFLFVFNTFFAIGWLGMSWLLPAELVPLSIRAPANAISTAGNWAFNFMVVMITPVAFNSIHSYTYTIFAVINALIIPAVYWLYPETKGRSLEEMDDIFARCPTSKPWQVVQIEKATPRTGSGRRLAEHDIESTGKPEVETNDYMLESD